jgi:hypothetical protein
LKTGRQRKVNRRKQREWRKNPLGHLDLVLKENYLKDIEDQLNKEIYHFTKPDSKNKGRKFAKGYRSRPETSARLAYRKTSEEGTSNEED